MYVLPPAVAPVIQTPPENLTVVQPEDANFFCEATARPGPTITWWRMEDGGAVQLMDGADYTIVDGATGERVRNSNLTVVGTQPSDALDYFCRATNIVDDVEATAEFIVHGESMRIATEVLVLLLRTERKVGSTCYSCNLTSEILASSQYMLNISNLWVVEEILNLYKRFQPELGRKCWVEMFVQVQVFLDNPETTNFLHIIKN